MHLSYDSSSSGPRLLASIFIEGCIGCITTQKVGYGTIIISKTEIFSDVSLEMMCYDYPGLKWYDYVNKTYKNLITVQFEGQLMRVELMFQNLLFSINEEL